MGMFSGIGTFVNDVLGGTSAGVQSQKYAKQSMQIQNAYNKEAAQNAHQWEIQDLMKAGLNPVLSAGGGGASMNGSSAIAGHEQPGQLDLLGSVTSAYKTVKDAQLSDEQGQTEATKRLLNISEAEKNGQLTPVQAEALRSQIALNESQKVVNSTLAKLNISQEDKNKVETAYLNVLTAKTEKEAEIAKQKLEKLVVDVKIENNPYMRALNTTLDTFGKFTGAVGNIWHGSSSSSSAKIHSESIHYNGDF